MVPRSRHRGDALWGLQKERSGFRRPEERSGCPPPGGLRLVPRHRSARALARLFAAARLHINFFQPSFKLKEKRRGGAKVIKRYHAPATPYERALAHPAVDEAVKRRLHKMYCALDPITLLTQMREAQDELAAHHQSVEYRLDKESPGFSTGVSSKNLMHKSRRPPLLDVLTLSQSTNHTNPFPEMETLSKKCETRRELKVEVKSPCLPRPEESHDSSHRAVRVHYAARLRGSGVPPMARSNRQEER